MKKVSNALIIDDKINLLVNSPENVNLNDNEYRNLKSIHDFFLKHSIPFNIIDGFESSIELLVNRLQQVTKPDLVVLDLDLNSNGEIDNYDVELLFVIIQTLKLRFYDFIILIYSSQEDAWPDVKGQLLEKDNTLLAILDEKNTILLAKHSNWTQQVAQKLDIEISTKAAVYFNRQIDFINSLYSRAWNKEALVILLLFTTLLVIIHVSFKSSNLVFLISTIVIMIIVSLKFLSENKNRIIK
jgi:hypothetical protein